MSSLSIDGVLSAMRSDGRFYGSPRVGSRVGVPPRLWRRTERGTFALVSNTWLHCWIAEYVSPDVPTNLAVQVLASGAKGFPVLTDEIAGVPIAWPDTLPGWLLHKQKGAREATRALRINGAEQAQGDTP